MAYRALAAFLFFVETMMNMRRVNSSFISFTVGQEVMRFAEKNGFDFAGDWTFFHWIRQRAAKVRTAVGKSCAISG